MRQEIKFRGKSTENGRWVYGDYRRRQEQYDDDMWHEVSCIYLKDHDYMIEVIVEEKTVGQYTGIRDSKGNEIYDGDICATPIYRNRKIEQHIFAVKWDEIEVEFENHLGWNISSDDMLSVIGNKYENPEILDGNGE